MKADAQMKTEVMEALRWEPTVASSNINVTANEGGLVATVHSWDERQEASTAAWNAPGLTDVENNLALSN